MGVFINPIILIVIHLIYYRHFIYNATISLQALQIQWLYLYLHDVTILIVICFRLLNSFYVVW